MSVASGYVKVLVGVAKVLQSVALVSTKKRGVGAKIGRKVEKIEGEGKTRKSHKIRRNALSRRRQDVVNVASDWQVFCAGD